MSPAHLASEGFGVAMVLFGLREVFRDIFHPTLSGTLSEAVGRITSLLLRHTRWRPSVGPLSLVLVIVCWVSTLVCGFALIYLGQAPHEIIGSAASATLGEQLIRCFYLSLGTFDTFQTFDLKLTEDWLRVLIALEGLIGIAMITASVSWLVLLYPALARERQYARRVSVLLQAERESGLSLISTLGVPVLTELSQGMLQFRLDVVLFPILLNFYPSDSTVSIATVLPEVYRLACDACSRTEPDALRLAGLQLKLTLRDLANTLCERVSGVQGDDPEATFRAFEQRLQ